MGKNFSTIFYKKGYYDSENNEVRRIDLLLDALKCQEEIHGSEDE
ncbi:hypothetical protein [Clostridium paraputrificum]|nr:hypothetical protein [Clostridium paraputrificum]